MKKHSAFTQTMNLMNKPHLMPLFSAGYKAYLSGFDSMLHYLDGAKNKNEFTVYTDADLAALGSIYEDIEFSVSTLFDARLEESGTTYNFILAAKQENDAEFARSLSQKNTNAAFSVFYNIQTDVYHDPDTTYRTLRDRILDAKKVSDPSSTFIAQAIHLMHTYDFKLTNFSPTKQFNILKQTAINPESMRLILTLILSSKDIYSALIKSCEYGLLELCLPELFETKNIFQDKEHHPEGDVFTHTLECFKYIDSPSLTLALALLLHDIGKPDTASSKSDERFHDHAYKGAQKAVRILKRLEFGKDLEDDVFFLINNHLVAREIARRSPVKRTEFMKHRLFPTLLKLYKADISSCFGDLEAYSKIMSMYNKSAG